MASGANGLEDPELSAVDLLFLGTYQLYKSNFYTRFPFSHEFLLVLGKLINRGHRVTCAYYMRNALDLDVDFHVGSNEDRNSPFEKSVDTIRNWRRALLCCISSRLGKNINAKHFLQTEIVRSLRKLLQAGIILYNYFLF